MQTKKPQEKNMLLPRRVRRALYKHAKKQFEPIDYYVGNGKRAKPVFVPVNDMDGVLIGHKKVLKPLAPVHDRMLIAV